MSVTLGLLACLAFAAHSTEEEEASRALSGLQGPVHIEQGVGFIDYDLVPVWEQQARRGRGPIAYDSWEQQARRGRGPIADDPVRLRKQRPGPEDHDTEKGPGPKVLLQAMDDDKLKPYECAPVWKQRIRLEDKAAPKEVQAAIEGRRPPMLVGKGAGLTVYGRGPVEKQLKLDFKGNAMQQKPDFPGAVGGLPELLHVKEGDELTSYYCAASPLLGPADRDALKRKAVGPRKDLLRRKPWERYVKGPGLRRKPWERDVKGPGRAPIATIRFTWGKGVGARKAILSKYLPAV